MSNSFNYKYNILIFLLFYISLLLGFYYDENLNFGAIGDWLYTDLPVIESTSTDFKFTILNYDTFGHRHSPVYLFFLGFLKKIGFKLDLIRFFHLHLSLLLIYFFFQCLKVKFKNINNNILLLIAFSIFLSPTFRSLSIWPSTRIIGLIFFLLAILEFLKYQKTFKEIYIWKNLIYLILSSYISPNFSVFVVFFFFHYLQRINYDKIIYFVIFCLISSVPALYYLFVLDINFLTAGTPGIEKNESIGLDINMSNKILIISSIVFFHLIPFIINKNFFKEVKKIINKNVIIYTAIFLIINIFFFDYILNFTGGGVFFQLSQYTFGNNLIFYFFCFISLITLFYFINNNMNNFLILLLLIISNIQNTIYHKYYDPLILILFFTLFNTSFSKLFLNTKKIFYYLYSFYGVFIFMRIFKNYINLNI